MFIFCSHGKVREKLLKLEPELETLFNSSDTHTAEELIEAAKKKQAQRRSIRNDRLKFYELGVAQDREFQSKLMKFR